jgi:tetratricopeptide (TPR) repeat protein
VTDALADIGRREDDYRANKAAAQTEFDRKNYSTARDRLQQAQQAHPELFAAENLVARLNEATTLATSARGTSPTPSNPPTSPANTPPNASAPDQKALDGQRYVRTAADLIRQGKYVEADAAYAAAAKADPKNQDAAAAIARAAKFRTLRDRGVAASRSNGTAAAAQQALVDARNVDPDRFTREGLTAVLDRLTKSMGDDPLKVALRQGLLALLNGRAQESIAILEPAASGGGGTTAPLHAYLGVAYATQALSAPKPEDQSRLKDKATEQFRLAAAAEPGYRLSNRVVSPAIIRMYESAR